jgi:hypothetical protein
MGVSPAAGHPFRRDRRRPAKFAFALAAIPQQPNAVNQQLANPVALRRNMKDRDGN